MRPLVEHPQRSGQCATQRRPAFNYEDVAEALRSLIDEGATRTAQITDADFAEAVAAGFAETSSSSR